MIPIINLVPRTVPKYKATEQKFNFAGYMHCINLKYLTPGDWAIFFCELRYDGGGLTVYALQSISTGKVGRRVICRAMTITIR